MTTVGHYERLRKMSDNDLECIFDELGPGTVWSLSIVREELARRESARQHRMMLNLTRQMRSMTMMITVLTVVITFLTATNVFAVLAPLF